MRAIAATLESLPDADARARVLRWASDLFGVGVNPRADGGPSPTARADAPVDGDASLVVSDLESFFEPSSRPNTPRPAPQDERKSEAGGVEPEPSLDPARAEARRDKGVGSKLQGLVSDFQKLTRDWRDE